MRNHVSYCQLRLSPTVSTAGFEVMQRVASARKLLDYYPKKYSDRRYMIRIKRTCNPRRSKPLSVIETAWIVCSPTTLNRGQKQSDASGPDRTAIEMPPLSRFGSEQKTWPVPMTPEEKVQKPAKYMYPGQQLHDCIVVETRFVGKSRGQRK